MKKLSKKKYWDSVHSECNNLPSHPKGSKLKELIESIIPNAPWGQNLGERQKLVIYDRYLPIDKNLRVIEIGCAPGGQLLSYHKRYGYEPWGIEYSHSGVIKTQEAFEAVGLNAKHIIEADFFAKEIIDKYSEAFDVVTSHGFIEHFDDTAEVIRRHVKLLRPGGFLLVSIPNLRWFNYFRVWMTYPEKLAMHNLAIMKLSEFRRLFQHQDFNLKELFVGYYGTFTLRPLFPKWLPDCDGAVDKIVWLIVGDRGFETPLFSPHLMYLGRHVPK